MARITDGTNKNNIELYAEWFMFELKDYGYIKEILREPFKLEVVPQQNMQRYKVMKTKLEVEDFKVLNPLKYTFDYMIKWDEKAQDIFYTLLDGTPHKTNTPFYAYRNTAGEIISLCDVKPPFAAKSFAGQNTTQYTFPLNQKVLMYHNSIYVNKLIPIPIVRQGEIKSGNAEALFTSCFCPQRYRFTDGGGQPRKIHYKIRTLQQYVQIKEQELNHVNNLLAKYSQQNLF